MAVALVLVVVTGVAAQQVYTGSVLRIDPSAGVVVFQDGRMFQTTADTVIISNNQRMLLSSLNQGTTVALYSAQPVALRDGRYVLLSDAGSRAAMGHVTTMPPSGPTIAVVPPPPPPVGAVVTPPGTVVMSPGTTVVTPPSTVAVGPAFETSGYVVRADDVGRSIIFDDGRKVRLTDDTQVLRNGVDPVLLSTLKPGTHVVIRSVRPFSGSRGEWVPMNEVARGTVVRVDQPGVIVLNDGRAYRTTPETVVYVDRRPVSVTTVRPGTRVVIYQDGTTMAVVSEPAASPALVPEAGLQQKEQDRPSGN
ncbi:MAG: hypothetical protein HYU41_13405 [Candidatus Rokubacteria bacterium]|nr:hypothetical protein [Candidatus Rokubacteria bacterium]